MKKLFLDVTFATLCAALLAACGGDSGSSADSLDESSSSSEMDGAESSDSEDLNSNGSEGSEGESSGSGGGESSGSSEGNSSSASEGVEGSSASVPGGSSDANLSGGSLIVANPCKTETEDNCEYGSLTDSRDGQTYRTVKIGGQVWMAENLNYAYTGVPYRFYEEYFDETYTSDSTSWCYDNDPANCAKYGRLYTWAAAMDSVGTWSANGKGCGDGKTCSVASAGSATLVRGVCPKGWHLPSYDEWEALFTAVGGSSTAGSKLKSATGWAWNDHDDISGNGTDAFGFSALPAGYRDGDGDYNYEGYHAYFWSSTGSSSNRAYSMSLDYYDDNAGMADSYKDTAFSVRCLKD